MVLKEDREQKPMWCKSKLGQYWKSQSLNTDAVEAQGSENSYPKLKTNEKVLLKSVL